MASINHAKYVRYVRHLTPQVICALAATTSKNQLRVLRDFIARHLEFDSHIGVGPIVSFHSHVLGNIVLMHSKTTASSQFSLEFHVPFYALKSRKSQSLDDRGLRNAIDISFLAPPFEVTARIADHEGDTYLQQSQVSFVVSGHDRCAWTGYLFTDIYQSRVESLLAKFNGATLTPPRDPITRGSTDLHAYTSQPREYFIQVLRVTLRETLNEWLSITMKVHDAIARFEDQFGAEKLLAYHITNPSLEDAYRRLTRWMNATSNLLATLIRTLESTVESWNRFTSGSLNYFHDPHGSSNVNVTSRQSLVAMSEHFGILDNLATGLKSDKHVVENLGRLAERQFEHFMQMSTAKAAVSEADNIKALTWITIVR
ncbi:hypothetical protein GGR57DRAFT_285886 [Xylariaceae sp. FL1272]|nr:hypothetical protein GGR57DRAFT_285886 [Xylariaceae sp. FL1272]